MPMTVTEFALKMESLFVTESRQTGGFYGILISR